MKRTVAALSLILLLAHPLSGPAPTAQEEEAPQAASGTIRGTLVDANGQPLVGYKIQVVDTKGTIFESGLTGADGKYEIVDLPPGQYSYQIVDPQGNPVAIRVPPVTLEAGTAVTQPIAIVPRTGRRKGPLIAWLVGGGAAVAALAIAASNNGDDERDEPSMTAGGN